MRLFLHFPKIHLLLIFSENESVFENISWKGDDVQITGFIDNSLSALVLYYSSVVRQTQITPNKVPINLFTLKKSKVTIFSLGCLSLYGNLLFAWRLDFQLGVTWQPDKSTVLKIFNFLVTGQPPKLSFLLWWYHGHNWRRALLHLNLVRFLQRQESLPLKPLLSSGTKANILFQSN